MKFLKNNWPLFVLIILSGLILWPVFVTGYFSHHDDLQVMRIYEMRRCFEDGQLPCRWVPDMGFGNGFPLFNYYGVLPYYIGGLLSYVLGFIGAAKALFFIPLVLGSITSYFLFKELFGKYSGLVGGTLFAFAPYRALDSYVRGAVAESFAIALAPLIFLFSYKLIKSQTKINFAAFTFSLAAFLLCHNLMSFVFIPLLGIWMIFWLIFTKFRNLLLIVVAGLLGIGLAAFFLIPAFFEQNLVQIDTLTQYASDFRTHFVDINQLFISRYWGYGASSFGPNDTLSFQIGWPHWWLALISLIFIFLNYKKRKFFFLGVSSFILFLGSAFLMHERSIFIWKLVDPLKFLQFPWRLLSLTIFLTSLLGALCVFYLKGKIQLFVSLIIVALTVGLNWGYFKPDHFYTTLTDKEKLSGKLFEIQQQAGILDYLPSTAQEPKSPRPDKPEVITGQAEVEKFISKSNKWSFTVKVKDRTNIEVPVFDFPNWTVYLNNSYYSHSHGNKLGRIRLDLTEGEYQVRGELKNTPIRNIANIMSILSVIILLLLMMPFRENTKIWK